MFSIAARYALSPCSSPLLLRRSSTLDASAIERLKKPTRGGQNLSQRYRRLEQSLRGKEALQKDILARESDVSGHLGDVSPSAQTKDANRYFQGLEIPRRPKPPESDGKPCSSLFAADRCSFCGRQNAVCRAALYACTIFTRNRSRRTESLWRPLERL